ncbi:aryl-alcohol dehydrogenase-like predicted oxidoreductase [Xanthomonas arboricola]|uniref:aldo/keto reductase n=1 Tax=Xanthomonas euroxanthea TaxID=2259622 RepID=UPI00142F48EF|nr:aldo/keto reductase [Xanthomonas euroxanthea]NJC37111.1 aryl-alcohol dehydrogenase-like predicted oxidoreductase [Xanthomonas euroxanthea]
MRYVFLGETGLRISQLCLGMADFGTRIPPDVSQLIWNRSIDAGINLFDTADAAPESEALLGAFAHEKRQALVISNKVFRQTGPGVNDAGLSRKHIVQACEVSLRRLKTDYIDVYLAHSDDFLTPIEETLSAFDQLVRQGKVLYVGVSNYTAWRLNEALWIALIRNCTSYCCIQALYNLRNRDIEVDLLPMCLQKGIGVLAWSPLARGALTEKGERSSARRLESWCRRAGSSLRRHR